MYRMSGSKPVARPKSESSTRISHAPPNPRTGDAGAGFAGGPEFQRKYLPQSPRARFVYTGEVRF